MPLVDTLNDQFQQSTSPAAGLAILKAASGAALRALADLNYVEGDAIRGLMADRFGDDWAEQVAADEPPAPVTNPYYARTFSATTRHVINPDAPGGTLCGHRVSLRDEFVGDDGVTIIRPAAWMILDLPPCERCTRSEAARGMTPPARSA
jgi:hypothetical protein